MDYFMQGGRSQSASLEVESLMFGEIMLKVDGNALYDFCDSFKLNILAKEHPSIELSKWKRYIDVID